MKTKMNLNIQLIIVMFSTFLSPWALSFDKGDKTRAIRKINDKFEEVIRLDDRHKGGEATGNPDSTFNIQSIELENYLSFQDRKDFFNSMQLSDDVLNMFQLIGRRERGTLIRKESGTVERNGEVFTTETPIYEPEWVEPTRSRLANYDLINGRKIRLSNEDRAQLIELLNQLDPEDLSEIKYDIRFAETPRPGQIIWYPLGIGRNTKRVHLTYAHELIHSFLSKNEELNQNPCSISEMNADLWLLMDPQADIEKKTEARRRISERLNVYSYDELVAHYSNFQLNPQNGFILSALTFNGANFIQASAPSTILSHWSRGIIKSKRSKAVGFWDTDLIQFYLERKMHQEAMNEAMIAMGFSKQKETVFKSLSGHIFVASYDPERVLGSTDGINAARGAWTIRDYESTARTSPANKPIQKTTVPIQLWLVDRIEFLRPIGKKDTASVALQIKDANGQSNNISILHWYFKMGFQLAFTGDWYPEYAPGCNSAIDPRHFETAYFLPEDSMDAFLLEWNKSVGKKGRMQQAAKRSSLALDLLEMIHGL